MLADLLTRTQKGDHTAQAQLEGAEKSNFPMYMSQLTDILGNTKETDVVLLRSAGLALKNAFVGRSNAETGTWYRCLLTVQCRDEEE